MNKTLKVCAAFLTASMMIAAPVSAQEAAPPASDGASDSDIIAAAIGCAATYDYLLTATPGDSKMIEARDFAMSIYKQYSNESDAEIASDLVEADKLLVDMITRGELTIAEVRPTCDAVFMAEVAPGTTPGAT